jgi:hypothetical protein
MTSGANIPINSYSITDDFGFWVEAAKWASEDMDYKGKKLVQYKEKKAEKLQKSVYAYCSRCSLLYAFPALIALTSPGNL